jgi:hypothetical protein
VSLHINQEKSKLKKSPITDPNDYTEKAKKLYSSVAKLSATAAQKNTVSSYLHFSAKSQQEEKRLFKTWFLEQLQVMEANMKENGIIPSEFIGVDFVPESSTPTFWSLFSRKELLFV